MSSLNQSADPTLSSASMAEDGRISIHVGPEDTLPSLRSRLGRAEGDTVQVVIPRGHPAFQSELGLEYLQRHARALGKRLVIESRDPAVRRAARARGVALAEAERLSRGKAEAQEQAPAARQAPFSLWWLLAVLGVAAVVIWSGAAVIPSATVVVRPASQLLSEAITVTAAVGAQEVDPASATVPARKVEVMVEVSGSVATTGRALRPETPATGQVAFVNRSMEAVVVPAGTRLATDDGVEFVTVGHVMLPPALQSTATAGVVALEPGSQGNVAAQSINRILNPALAARLWVVNELPTSGGTDTGERTVSADDRRLLEHQLEEAARQGGMDALQASAGAEGHVFTQSVTAELVSLNTQQEEGDESDVLEGRGSIQLRGLAVDGSAIEELARLRLAAGAPQRLVPGTLRTEYQGVVRADEESISFRLFSQASVLPAVDTEALRRGLTGKSVAEAQAFLRERLGLTEPPEVKLSPLWVRSLPRFSWRITVRVLPGG